MSGVISSSRRCRRSRSSSLRFFKSLYLSMVHDRRPPKAHAMAASRSWCSKRTRSTSASISAFAASSSIVVHSPAAAAISRFSRAHDSERESPATLSPVVPGAGNKSKRFSQRLFGRSRKTVSKIAAHTPSPERAHARGISVDVLAEFANGRIHRQRR